MLVIAAVVLAAAAAGWLLLPRVQEMRADRMLTGANEDIAAANEVLSGIDLSTVSLESFVSLESIVAASTALEASLPALEDARARVESAAQAADAASGLYRLPQGYVDYLEAKAEVARLRIEQLDALETMIAELQPLYDDGDIIFTAIEEMDRLWGQVEYNIRTLQGDPAAASSGLAEAAASMRAIKQQVDSRFEESRFFLLESLAESIEENAVLADLARELADAVGIGDQARVQDAAVAMEAQLLQTSDTSGFIDIWMEYSLMPAVENFTELQEEQEELDEEAAALFAGRS